MSRQNLNFFKDKKKYPCLVTWKIFHKPITSNFLANFFIPILSFFNNYIATPLKLCSQLHCQAPDDLRRRIFLAPRSKRLQRRQLWPATPCAALSGPRHLNTDKQTQTHTPIQQRIRFNKFTPSDSRKNLITSHLVLTVVNDEAHIDALWAYQ